jgi:Max protein
MMSEEERDIDVEDDGELNNDSGSGGMSDSKRALHNAMERKRRDSIKDSFRGLQDCIPTLRGDKTSRAQVLKKTGDYISQMQTKISKHQNEISDLKTQNAELEAQIRAMEKAKTSFGSSLLRSDSILSSDIDITTQEITFEETSSDASLFTHQDVIYEDSSSDTSDSIGQINLSGGGIVKTISGVTLAPNAVALSTGSGLSTVSLGGGSTMTINPTVTLNPPATMSIAPGQSLLHSSIRVQPGQSLLLTEPMRKKKKIN